MFMKPKHLTRWLSGYGLALLLTGLSLHGQQNEADSKLLAGFRSEAERGDALSQSVLGDVFHFGKLGVAKDEAEAVKWYHKAAEQNHAPAQYSLGACYMHGQGIGKDEIEAVKWWRKAAEQNHPLAQSDLGYCYEKGRGIGKDEVEGLKWYRRGAEQNCAEAQYNLGVCYAKGRGVVKDDVEAVKWYRRAIEQNHALSLYNLGACYDTGQGVEKDLAEALKWYRRAAELNQANAQFNLGYCYAKGEGLEKDPIEAVKWYRKAAEQGHARAEVALGYCYEKGQGVANDSVEAVRWYRQAAEQGHANGQYNLGVCYGNGQGVATDDVAAYMWFMLAAAQGNPGAKRNMSSAQSLWTADQIAEGQKLANNFKPREAAYEQTRSEASGTGFFITEDGYLITNAQVAREGARVPLVSETGIISAKVVKVDMTNHLALLKAEGKFVALPVSRREAQPGAAVTTLGFPNLGVQGFAPKLSKGEVHGLSGDQDDVRHFQITMPIQPGNAGGALLDERGNVIGVVEMKLSHLTKLTENRHFAVRSSSLLGFLESVPAVAPRIIKPNDTDRNPGELVKAAQQATVLVLAE